MAEVKYMRQAIHLYSQCHEQCRDGLQFLRGLITLYEQHHEICKHVSGEKRITLDQELESHKIAHRQATHKISTKSNIPNNLEIIEATFNGSPTTPAKKKRKRTRNSDSAVTTFTSELPKIEQWEPKLHESGMMNKFLPAPMNFPHPGIALPATTRERAEYRARETVAWIEQAETVESVTRFHLFCFLSYCVVLENDGMDSEVLNDIMKLVVVRDGTATYLKSLRTQVKLLHKMIVLGLVAAGWSIGQATLLFYFCGPRRVYQYTYFTAESCKIIVERVKGLRIDNYPGDCIGRYICDWDPSLSIEKVHFALGYGRISQGKPTLQILSVPASQPPSPESQTVAISSPLRLQSRQQSPSTAEPWTYIGLVAGVMSDEDLALLGVSRNSILDC